MLNRRGFLMACAAGLGAGVLGMVGCSGLQPGLPTACLEYSAARLLSYFEKRGWVWDAGRGRWVCPTYTFDARPAEASLLLWGPYDSVVGHWVDGDRLAAGVAPRAAALELSLSLESDNEFASIIQAIHADNGINEGMVLSRCSTLTSSGGMSGPFYEVCTYTVNGAPAVWWLTMNWLGGVVVGCSRLDYYAQRKHLEPTYEAVGASIGPWDLDIRAHV